MRCGASLLSFYDTIKCRNPQIFFANYVWNPQIFYAIFVSNPQI
jgi:hypothetical protein